MTTAAPAQISRRIPLAPAEPTMPVFLFRRMLAPAGALVIDLDAGEWVERDDADQWRSITPEACVCDQMGGK